MKDQKPWYEKIGIWITIVSGICAILGISLFGNKSVLKNNKDDNASINLENNEIKMEDQSAIVIGDNNTINYSASDSNSTQALDSSKSSVTASYDMNTHEYALNVY